jgi:hypothetical protein
VAVVAKQSFSVVARRRRLRILRISGDVSHLATIGFCYKLLKYCCR